MGCDDHGRHVGRIFVHILEYGTVRKGVVVILVFVSVCFVF